LKSPITIAEKYAHVVADIVSYHKIQLAVAIEVSNRRDNRSLADTVVHGGLERSITVTQENADVVAIGIGHGQVQFMILIEITGY
jgi:hypothetical protein